MLAIFLLAMASALGLIIGSNSLSARKSARMASYRAAAAERAALATWMAADALDKPQNSSHFVFSIEGRELSAAVSPETGRIDLNGLPTGGLAQAIHELGYDPAAAGQAAAALSDWRGTLFPNSNGLAIGLPDGRRAFWSIDDLDEVATLETGVRECLKLWGTAHARGTFLAASLDNPLSLTSEIGVSGNIVVGSMVRIIAQDHLTGLKFRSILLYGGGQFGRAGGGTSPWLIIEWLEPAKGQRCEVKGG